MVLLAGRRTPKRVGYHDVYVTGNHHQEWSLRVEPDGLQIDTYHSKGKSVHLHPPGDYGHPIELAPIEFARAQQIVYQHLFPLQAIRLAELVEELSKQ